MSAGKATAPVPLVDTFELAARALRHAAHVYARTKDDARKEQARAKLEQAAVEFSLAKLKASLS